MTILDELKVRWQPTAAETKHVLSVAQEFSRLLGRKLKSAKCVIGGSGAKGTWLRGMHDIDIFACFDYSKYKDRSAELSDLLGAALKAVFPKATRLHGSRDYFRVSYKGYFFEVVPILGITRASQARNITDASLLHAAWVRKQISKRSGLANEIRLTKAFCKAQGIYGAESHIMGFSGYSCEVLTAYFGSFEALLRASLGWKARINSGKKIVIDAAGLYKGADPLTQLNSAKTQGFLVVIDPVQKDRNTTAALGLECLQKFIDAASQFLRKPSGDFFEKKEFSLERLKAASKGQLMVVEASKHSGKDDVVGSKLLKAQREIQKKLVDGGFEVFSSGWSFDNSILWYDVAKTPAPELRLGPPVKMVEHAHKFRKQHKASFEKGGRLFAKVPRKFLTPEKLVLAAVSEPYIKALAKAFKVRKY